MKAPAAAQPTYDDDDFHEFSDPAAADEQIAALIAAAEAEAAAEAGVEAIVARVEAIVAHSDAAAQA